MTLKETEMVIRFNDFNNKYDLKVGKNLPNEAKEAKKAQELKEDVKYEAFKGLENETDLLTKNTAGLYGVQLGKFTLEDKDLADRTNEILASLGCNYKVSEAQVASVTAGVREVVIPGMKLALDGAVAANIQDPNGPFAELFT